MKQVTMIGLDLAKAVFQVHGVDQSGVVTLRRSRGLRHPQRDLDRVSEAAWCSRYHCI
jgi:hypothetical protein